MLTHPFGFFFLFVCFFCFFCLFVLFFCRYRGTAFPSQYRGAYIFGDYVRNELKLLQFGASGQVSVVSHLDDLNVPIAIAPGDAGSIFVTTLEGTLVRYTYTGPVEPGTTTTLPGVATTVAATTGATQPLSCAGRCDLFSDTDVCFCDATCAEVRSCLQCHGVVLELLFFFFFLVPVLRG